MYVYGNTKKKRQTQIEKKKHFTLSSVIEIEHVR